MQDTYWKLLLAFTIPLGLSSCSEAPADVALGPFVGQIIGWQTYCSINYDAGASDRPFGNAKIRKLEVATDHSHSMYGFLKSGRVYLRDLVSGEQWALKDDRFIPHAPTDCDRFQAGGITVVNRDDYIEACDASCHRVSIKPGTWVYAYAYAYANNSVLAATNYGDILTYRSGAWCRMSKTLYDTYRCFETDEPAPTLARGLQFYSSLSFGREALVGEWPTGKIYRFDGEELHPLQSQPPFVTDEPMEYEAQSMAAYCGDLYVGYWPTGEIWRLDTATGEWSLAADLFRPPANSSNIPAHVGRQNPDGVQNFYGRRVSALIPERGGLIAMTSNKSGWGKDFVPDFMSKEESEQYGSIYKVEIRCAMDTTSLSYRP